MKEAGLLALVGLQSELTLALTESTEPAHCILMLLLILGRNPFQDTFLSLLPVNISPAIWHLNSLHCMSYTLFAKTGIHSYASTILDSASLARSRFVIVSVNFLVGVLASNNSSRSSYVRPLTSGTVKNIPSQPRIEKPKKRYPVLKTQPACWGERRIGVTKFVNTCPSVRATRTLDVGWTPA